MRYLLKYFVKRLPREGFKSLSVPALALALVFLINVMGGVQARMEAEYEYTMDNFPIIVEVFDGDGISTDNLTIGEPYLDQFTDPEALWSLYDYIDNVRLRRTFEMVEKVEVAEIADGGKLVSLYSYNQIIEYITKFHGLDESEFSINYIVDDDYWDNLTENMYYSSYYSATCVVSEAAFEKAQDGYISFFATVPIGAGYKTGSFNLEIVGTISGLGNEEVIFASDSAVMMNLNIDHVVFNNICNAKLTSIVVPGFNAIVRDYVYIPYPEDETKISFLEGYDASIFTADEYYCVVSEDVLQYAKDGKLSVSYTRWTNTYTMNTRRITLIVVGVIETEYTEIVSSPYLAFQTGYDYDYWFLIQEIDFDSPGHDSMEFRNTAILRGVTIPGKDVSSTPEESFRIDYYDGYDDNIFYTDEKVCLISTEMLPLVENGVYKAEIRSPTIGLIEMDFKVIGTMEGTWGNVVYAPFMAVYDIDSQTRWIRPYTEVMGATIADNRKLGDFKQNAMRTFKEVGVFFNTQVFSMIIYDSEFYNITEALTQTIFFIDIATPFVYVIAIGVGFVASFLLTRRRKGEFAMMRSVGVNKVSIFFGALFEQTMLCAVGAALGCVLFTLTWDLVFIRRPLIFLGCYMLGAMISAARAAGTDVLRLLRDKE